MAKNGQKAKGNPLPFFSIFATFSTFQKRFKNKSNRFWIIFKDS